MTVSLYYKLFSCNIAFPVFGRGKKTDLCSMEESIQYTETVAEDRAQCPQGKYSFWRQ